MKTRIRVIAWLSGCLCLIVLTLSVFLWLSPPHTKPVTALSTNNELTASLSSTAQPQVVIDTPPSDVAPTTALLPPVPYTLGSVGEACEVNTYPPITLITQETVLSPKNSPFDSTGEWKLLKEPKCRTALDKHMNAINPWVCVGKRGQ